MPDSPLTATASLPMYDLPEVRQATDAWWHGIARHLQRAGLRHVPARLQHDIGVRVLWDAPNLFLSQCCGFDIIHRYRNRLQVIMTTDWNADGCATGQYSSWVVVHEDSAYQCLDDLFNSTAVINGPESHSGMNALLSLISPLAQEGHFFKAIDISGSHAASLQAVQQRQADVAAIDCVTFALLKRYRPAALQGIRRLQQTALAPAHPYVVTARTPADQIQRIKEGLQNALNDADLYNAREAILLRNGLFQGAEIYQQIREKFSFDQRLLTTSHATGSDHHSGTVA